MAGRWTLSRLPAAFWGSTLAALVRQVATIASHTDELVSVAMIVVDRPTAKCLANPPGVKRLLPACIAARLSGPTLPQLLIGAIKDRRAPSTVLTGVERPPLVGHAG